MPATYSFSDLIRSVTFAIIDEGVESRMIGGNANDFFRICFLGTGCATPSKHRNNSAILISFPSISKDLSPSKTTVNYDVSILLDAGEGVCGQLYRHYGGDSSRFFQGLLTIRIVWISHQHCDHVAGFPLLLQYIYRARILSKGNMSKRYQSSERDQYEMISKDASHSSDESHQSHRISHNTTQISCNESLGCCDIHYPKILVICPENIRQFYEYTACISGLDDLITFIPITSTLYAGLTIKEDAGFYNLNKYITKIQSIPVYHCQQAYGVILYTSSHHKIVYSGDCRPNSSLINYGQDCDVLIHEATFDDSFHEDALKKKHCTVSEAYVVGKKMNAKHIVLTHFSQRYPVHQSTTKDSETLSNASSKRDNILTGWFRGITICMMRNAAH